MKKPRYLSTAVIKLAMALYGLGWLLSAVLGFAAWRAGGFFVIGAFAGVFGLVVIGWLWRKRVWLPYRENERLFALFADGFASKDVLNPDIPLTPGLLAAFRVMAAAFDVEEQKAQGRRQAQYLALQNQINPHFLYNTLEGIRGEAITAGLDNVARMTEALATFFRYTISNVDRPVTLEEELDNIQNYYTIQKYRFGGRISLEVAWDEEDRETLYKCRLPKLTLQPIVENAIVHGLERKLGSGLIRIKLTATGTRLIINVSDNGLGMDENRLRELSAKLRAPFGGYEKAEGNGGAGIAMVNVNNRIQLLYGEEYGITVMSSPGQGADVEIVLPLQREPS